VRIAWTDNSATENGFRIERATDGATFTTLIDLPANTTTHDDAGLQSFVNYSYRVRALTGPAQSNPSNVAAAMPALSVLTGTGGNDRYDVRRADSQIRVFENADVAGPPTYFAEIAAMGATLEINVGDGNDTLNVNSVGQPTLGLVRVIYNAGNGTNTLVLEAGGARIDGVVAGGGTLNSTVQAGAHLTTARLNQNELALGDNGRVTLLADGDTSKITSLTLGTGATLDITDNALVLDYTGDSPVSTIRDRILSGRGGSGLGRSWNGPGINSSAAAQANQSEPESRSVGYAENALLPLGAYTTFRGMAVDATSVLIAYARTGDANLDGLVNDDDVTVLGASYAPAASGGVWALGDFEYNGFADDDDVTLLGAFYNPAVTPLTAPVMARSLMVPWSPNISRLSVVVPSPNRATAAIAGPRVLDWAIETFRKDEMHTTAVVVQNIEVEPRARLGRAVTELADLLASSIADDLVARSSSFSDTNSLSRQGKSGLPKLWP
jgi:hypothetical protein